MRSQDAEAREAEALEAEAATFEGLAKTCSFVLDWCSKMSMYEYMWVEVCF